MKNQTYRMTMLFDFYGEILTDRQKEFFDLYYNEDLSLAEIAENYGISRQGVRDVIVRAEAAMTELEDKTGLIRRFEALRPHLDAIQFSSASSRKFVLVLPLDEKAGADEGALRQLEKAICDHGLRVRLAEEQDVKRLLAIYYRQDLTTEVFRDFDGEEYVHG